MACLWAEQALTAEGWRRDVRVTIGKDGRIASVGPGVAPEGQRVGVLLPSPANLHSHAFQRAMAGLAEQRGPDLSDGFRAWRKLMYRFLAQLGPEDIQSITAFAQMEMLEAGFAAVGEFHYVHHQASGAPYDSVAELAHRIVAAAAETGIGLTLLPVLYRFGGCGRPLEPGQIRFGNDPERFGRIYEEAQAALRDLAADGRVGVAPHSLRAVDRDGLAFAATLAPDAPVHIHVAEQASEVEEVEAHLGARPVEWLLDNAEVNDRWCLIHATHMLPRETAALARSGAVAGLCPITEANLGDGTFDGMRYQTLGGTFGLGTDSNIDISLAGELRMLEYSQRLKDRARSVMSCVWPSTGRSLFEAVARGGAEATMRDSVRLSRGKLADLVALDAEAPNLAGRKGDDLLDSFVFTGNQRMITDVWSAGRHVVSGGRHVRRDQIVSRYRAMTVKLMERL